MTNIIPDTFPFSLLDDYLSTYLGLHFSKARRHDLERGLAAASNDLGFDDPVAFARWLIATPATKETVEVLASHLTVGETYFFREEKYYQALEEHILTILLQAPQRKTKSLKIWSAGCSTGEEPYSIAILLSKFIHILKDWNVTILATDINPLALKKAARGEYSEWSFRGTPEWVKKKYFRKNESGLLEIQPSVKQIVHFSYLNLAENCYPSYLNDTREVDIIFCRNVLMYFRAERRKLVVQRLYNCLVEGGWLAVSSSEISQELFSQFSPVNHAGAVLYKKNTIECASLDRNFILTKPCSAVRSEVPEAGLPEQTSEMLVNSQQEEPLLEDEDSMFQKALALYERCRYAEVTEKLTIAMSSIAAGNEQTPALEKFLVLMARANANLGKLHDAKECCEKAIALNKLDPSLHYLLATILQEQNQLEEAITALNRTLYLDRDYLPAHFALGNLKRLLGKQEEAIKHFNHALIILRSYVPGELLPGTDGMTAGRLSEMLVSMLS